MLGIVISYPDLPRPREKEISQYKTEWDLGTRLGNVTNNQGKNWTTTHTEILTDCPYAHDIHDDFRVVRTVEEDHGERLDQAVKKPGRK